MGEEPGPQAPKSHTAPPKKKAWWRQGRGLLASVLALPLLLGTAGCALWWGLATQSGGEWLLSHVPGLQIQSLQGSLVGDLSAKQLSYTLPGSSDRLVIDDLQWRGLTLAWNAAPGLWADLNLQSLRAKRVHLQLAPSQEASKPPTDLRLPLGLNIEALEVDELVLPSLSDKPLTALCASLALSADAGAQHRVKIERLHWDLLQLSAAARIQTGGMLELQAELAVRALANDEQGLPAWTSQAKLSGPLQAVKLTADLQALEQELQLQAQVQPFAAWPLPQARLNTHKLDLSALASGLPRTALTGQADLQLLPPAKPDAPALLNIKSELSNSMAGLWDTQRLPLRSLTLDLNVAPGDPAALSIKRLELLLGSAQQPAGRVHARGSSSKQSGSQMVIAVDGLRSAGLDSRVAALQLAGEIELSTGRAANQLSADGPPPLLLKLNAKLDGRWLATGAAPNSSMATVLSLQAQAQASRSELSLQSLKLQSDGSALQASGQLSLNQAGSLLQGWSAQAQASAQVADLRRFWRGNEGSAWQQNAQPIAAVFDAKLQAAPGQSIANNSARTAANLKQMAPVGAARLQILPTHVGGVPISADLNYQHAQRGSTPRLTLALQAGASNQLQAQASLNEAGQLLSEAELKFTELAALQPLLAAFSPAASKQAKPTHLAGSLAGKLKLQAAPVRGAATQDWSWQSQAQLQARTLQLSGVAGQAALKLASADLQWELDSAKDAVLAVKARLEQLSGNGWKLPSASAALQGSWAKHRLTLQAIAEGKMPPALIPPGQPTEQTLRGPVSFDLLGSLSAAPNIAWRDGAQWRASEIKLLAQAEPQSQPKLTNPSTSPSTKAELAKEPKAAWLKAQDLNLALDLGPAGALKLLRLEPGRMEVLGAGLRWQSMKWADAGLDIELALEPLAVAPLLARWQPDFGWGGDLQMLGHVRIKSSPAFQADIALERSGGDLLVSDDSGVQKLGLSDARIGVVGSNGLWHLTQALAGSNIGVLAGALTARNEDPSVLWPHANSKLEGVLEARIANLSTWGAWVPTGWRMGGSLFASAGFGGRLSAPEVKGRAGGTGLVLRNPLLGVDLQRGEFALSLDGGQARLEQFKAYSGDGELSAQGDLLFGASPRADLQVQADKFALLRRVDQRLAVNGKLELKLDADALDITGKLDVHEGFFDFSRGNAPTLDSDVEVRRLESAEAQGAGGAQHAAATASKRNTKVKVKIDIDLGKKLRVTGFGLDTLLAGDLQLTQATSGPALHGRIRTESGTFAAYGQKLAIERGLIIFNGVVDNPRLDVLAIRPTQEEQRIGVTIAGTARNPRVKLFSEPNLDERTMLSWLLLGRAPDELNSQDNALLSSAAMALLSGTGQSTTSKLIKSVGLDELSFKNSGDEAQGTVVRLGKQISNRWYVGYERGLNATRGSWQAIYRLAQRFTLRAQSGDDNSLDLIWQWRWE